MLDIHDISTRYTPTLLGYPNVVGVGVGRKVSGGKETGEDAVSVLVSKKMPRYTLSGVEMVPTSVQGIPTDVVEVGIIEAPPPDLDNVAAHNASWRRRMRPARPGCSVGHHFITAGTFGLLVCDDDHVYILSNCHVLANSGDCSKGDPIWQPGRYDGGCTDDHIASLVNWVPVRFTKTAPTCAMAAGIADVLNGLALLAGSSHRLEAHQVEFETNEVDAATAVPIAGLDVMPDILDGVGVPAGATSFELGQRVHKCGRTTYHTWGNVTQIDATVQVSYGSHGMAIFRNQQVLVGENGSMSAGGDSGSSVLDENNYVGGLLFAGSRTTTIINPIDRVLDLLDVRIIVT